MKIPSKILTDVIFLIGIISVALAVFIFFYAKADPMRVVIGAIDLFIFLPSSIGLLIISLFLKAKRNKLLKNTNAKS